MKCIILCVAAVSLFVSMSITDGQENAAERERITGRVIETTNAGTYTYVQVDTGKEKVWAAAPQFQVKVGDQVSFEKGMLMENFQSKTLKRTFKTVYFVDKIDAPGAGQSAANTGGIRQAMPNDAAHAGVHRSSGGSTPAKVTDFSGIKKAEGGLTVAQVHQQKRKLEKKQVIFRGKVVKYNAQIMNKNWLHVQDGTGAPGANDVTVTTDDAAEVGNTVLVKGTVVLNKDFGYGYKYDLVVENAKVVVERAK